MTRGPRPSPEEDLPLLIVYPQRVCTHLSHIVLTIEPRYNARRVYVMSRCGECDELLGSVLFTELGLGVDGDIRSLSESLSNAERVTLMPLNVGGY